VSKQRENSQIYQQLRMVQLEKENNDKIYTRIFTSNKKDKVTRSPLRKAYLIKIVTIYTPSSSNRKPLISDTFLERRKSDHFLSVLICGFERGGKLCMDHAKSII
jgi:hypothetical protein